MQTRKIIIPGNEHVFIAGKTGTGKTYLAGKYLSAYKQVYLLDTKGTTSWKDVKGKDITLITELKNLPYCYTAKVIYRPIWEEMQEEYYNLFFKFCYQKRNCVVWIDEVMSIATQAKIPEYYKAILTRGRELGIAAWSLTQRPSGIPQITISEATHFFIFDLNLKTDREKVTEVTGQKEFMKRPSKQAGGSRFNFYYYNVAESDYPTIAKLEAVKKSG